jgi:hypothetical protein
VSSFSFLVLLFLDLSLFLSSISAKISLFLHIGQTNLLSELIFDLVRHDLQKVCPQCNIFGILSLVLYLSKHISQRTQWRQT